MTTTQTIDGVLVSRELLQKWLDDIDPSKHVTQYAALNRDALRALMDADKVNSRQMGLMQFVEAHTIKPAEERGSSHGFEQSPNTCRHDERSGVRWREGSVTRTGRECRACGSVEEDPAKPAAHPRGEPMAFDYESAAQKIAECMDYSWAHMPEQGRSAMREYARAVVGAALSGGAGRPAPGAVELPDRDTMRDLIAQAIGGDTYDCTRAWSAWSVGTMSDDDFVPVVDQEARLYEITDICLEEFTRINAQ